MKQQSKKLNERAENALKKTLLQGGVVTPQLIAFLLESPPPTEIKGAAREETSFVPEIPATIFDTQKKIKISPINGKLLI